MNGKIVIIWVEGKQFELEYLILKSIGMSEITNKTISRRNIKEPPISTRHSLSQIQFDEIPNFSQKQIKHKMAQLKQKYLFPASRQIAEVHKQAQIYGKKFYGILNQDQPVKCPCCDKTLRIKQKSPLAYDVSEVKEEIIEYDRVKSVILFFEYIRFLISMVWLRFIITGAYSTYTNYYSGDFKDYIFLDFWRKTSSLHKIGMEQQIIVSRFLGFIVIPAFFLCAWVLQRSIYAKNQMIDAKVTSDDDYNILVSNIPLLQIAETDPEQLKIGLNHFFTSIIEQQLKQHDQQPIYESEPIERIDKTEIVSRRRNNFSQQAWIPSAPNLNRIRQRNDKFVHDVIFCYDITSIERIRDLRNDIMEKINSQIDKDANYGKQNIANICHKIQQLNELQVSQCYRFASADGNSDFFMIYFIGFAFITFKKEIYKEIILKKYLQEPQSLRFRDSQLEVKQPGHPSEIQWQNLKLGRKKRKVRILYTSLILFVFLIFCFALLSIADQLRRQLIGKHQNKIKTNNISPFMNTFVNSVTTLITMSINLFLAGFCQKLTEWECHETASEQKQHLIIKLVITQFVNTALIYWFLSLYNGEQNKDMMEGQGLISQVCNLIIVSGAIQLAVNYFNIDDIFRRVTRWLYYKKNNGEDRIYEFQQTVNDIEKYNQFDIAKRYSYYIVQLYTLSFYAYLVPVCDLVVGFFLIGNYWADKINLLTRSSFNCQFSYELTRIILILSQNSIVIYAAGVVIFSTYVDQPATINIIGLIFAFIYGNLWLFIPTSWVKKLNMIDINSNTAEGYNEKRMRQTYRKMNPATFLIPTQTV